MSRARLGLIVLAVLAAGCRTRNTPPAPAAVVDAGDPSLRAEIETMLGKALTKDGPGVAVGIVVRGEVRLATGYGFADLEKKTKIDSSTRFDLASVSKQLTAMALLMQVDKGLVTLDDDVRKHLPELPVADPARPVRVRDLLNMTSGFAEYTDDVDELPDKHKATNADILAWLVEQPHQFPTGTKWVYTNTNYVLVALIVERVAKRTFRSVLFDDILVPAEMKQTDLLDRFDRVIEKRAMGYQLEGNKWVERREDVPTTGDGNVFSSVDDLIRWDRVLREGKLVRRATLDMAFTSGKLDSGKLTDYGFGWQLRTLATKNGSKKVTEHNGGWTGTSTYFGRVGPDEVTVILLSNDESFEPDGDAIAKRFLQ